LKTYIRLKFTSRGTKPSEVYRILKEHDFVPAIGEYDFVYDWGEGRDAEMNGILDKLDAIHSALVGQDVIYEVTTSDPMYHIREMIPRLIHHQEKHIAPEEEGSKEDGNLSDDDAPKPLCPECNAEAEYIQKYDKFYCHQCKNYI
jgi:hypothetical protein